MLRRVALDEVRLGMFVHALEGSWLQHPFWKRRFLLESEADLQRLLESEIPGIVIDDERGAVPDSKPAPTPVAIPAAAPRARPAERPLIPLRRPSPPIAECSAEQERERASQVIARSLKQVRKMFGEARLGKAIQAADVAPVVEEIAASVARNATALIGIARLKSKDEYTYMHSVAVCALMINLARTLELDEGLIQEIGLAGLLHDMGKMGVPDPVLNKAGPLTAEEYDIVRQHPRRGYDMIVASPDASAIAAEVVLHHHERYDGTGYPDGLKGEAISLYARMGAICDVYDAITSNRPYKEGWTPAESIERMLEWDGHFDPKLLDTFVRSIGIYPIGTLVRLRSNRLGLVVAENKREPTQPKVRAFYAIHERALVKPETVRIGASLRDDAILKRELPEHWALGDWPKLKAGLLGR